MNAPDASVDVILAMRVSRVGCTIYALLFCFRRAQARYYGRGKVFKQVGSERGKGIEIRDQWADVFRKFCSGGRSLVLLRPDGDGYPEDTGVDRQHAVRLIYYAAGRAGKRSSELKKES